MPRRLAAFTLLEILVAGAIFAGVLAAIYSSWTAILTASSTAQRAAADVQRSRLAVHALEEALASAQMFPYNARHYAFLVDTSQEHTFLSFVSRLPDSYPRAGRFKNQPMRRVEFSVESDRGGGSSLLLRQNHFLFEPDREQVENPLRLANNVAMFLVEFLAENSDEWVEEWPSTNQLPRLVRFTLAVAPEGQRTVNREDVISRVVVLPPASAVRVSQQPARSIPGTRGSAPRTAPQRGGRPSPIRR